jgi:hypothetical protein
MECQIEVALKMLQAKQNPLDVNEGFKDAAYPKLSLHLKATIIHKQRTFNPDVRTYTKITIR